MHSSAHVIASRPVNVLPGYIGDLDFGSVAVLLAVDAGCDVDWLVYVGELDVAESYVLYVSDAGVGFDPY